jgi:hypothetical protein
MFINSQVMETQSTNQLKDMYFEISTATFLMGDGYRDQIIVQPIIWLTI